MADNDDLVILFLLSVPSLNFWDIVLFSEETAIQTVPTGLDSDPPEGPATPDVAIA